MGNVCLSCGACCAHFRVSFYWSETEPFLGGGVPLALTEQLTPHYSCMRGTHQAVPRCVALDGAIGASVACTIYPLRPSPCRELEPYDSEGQPSEKCNRARAAHGLPPLTPGSGRPVGPSEPPLSIPA